MHIAVSSGKYDVAEWLIKECSAEIHIKDFESGWNALHRSLFYGSIDCAILLIKVHTFMTFMNVTFFLKKRRKSVSGAKD